MRSVGLGVVLPFLILLLLLLCYFGCPFSSPSKKLNLSGAFLLDWLDFDLDLLALLYGVMLVI